MRRSIISLLAAASFAAPTAAQAQIEIPAAPSSACGATHVEPTQATLPAVKAATLCLINAERKQAGARPVRAQTALTQAATLYSGRMVSQGFFAHVSPQGDTMTQRIKRTTYLKTTKAWSIGENIAYGTGQLATAQSIVNGWMKSPGHKRNMLDPKFTEIGVGITLGSPKTTTRGATYVTEYGKRA